MADTKYTIVVPTHDNLGQELPDLAKAGQEHLYRTGVSDGATVTGPHRGFWRDYPEEGMNHLIAFTQDTPENDSRVKQLAVHIAELANQEAMHVTKEGGGHIHSWIIPNRNHRPGEGAKGTWSSQPSSASSRA